MKLNLEIAVQDGVKIRHEKDRIFLEIDTSKTKTDLWKTQIQFWLEDQENKNLSSGYMRVNHNDKLTFVKSR